MRTRPIFHSSDNAIRGHVFYSFLALSMQKHLDNLARQARPPPPLRSKSVRKHHGRPRRSAHAGLNLQGMPP